MSYRQHQFFPNWQLPKWTLPKLVFSAILAACLVLIGCGAHLNAADRVTPAAATSTSSQRSLAQEVLSGLGLAKRYDLYLGNSVDIAVATPNTKRDRFMAWLHQILVQKAGWPTVEEQYVTALTAKFSPAELSELVAIAKQPVVQKLIQSESQTYAETANLRRKLLFQVWDDYNNALFTPPPEVLKELSQPENPPPKGNPNPKAKEPIR